MTERSTAKKKRIEEPKASKKPVVPPVESDRASDHVAAIAETGAAEIDRLKAELAAAHRRIAELEQKHAEILNRIDWVIDSLHNLND